MEPSQFHVVFVQESMPSVSLQYAQHQPCRWGTAGALLRVAGKARYFLSLPPPSDLSFHQLAGEGDRRGVLVELGEIDVRLADGPLDEGNERAGAVNAGEVIDNRPSG